MVDERFLLAGFLLVVLVVAVRKMDSAGGFALLIGSPMVIGFIGC
jgi:hypothetical protein